MKAGDKVKYKSDDATFTYGKIYKVLNSGIDFITVESDNGIKWDIRKGDFELVEPTVDISKTETTTDIQSKIEYNKQVIENYKTYILQTENRISDLQAQLEQGKRWRAEMKLNQDTLLPSDREPYTYYFVDCDGDIQNIFDWGNYDDDYRYNTSNYHHTQSDAEAYKQAMLDVREKECDVFKKGYNHKYEGSRPTIFISYTFNYEEDADNFANQLKLILNVKE